MARRSGDRRKARPATNRHFPRTARLNTLLQQIVADYLERVDDDRLGFLTVTGVEVDADLNKAQVYISAFADEQHDDEILEALAEYRRPIQGEIGRSARLRKTPEVVFGFDPAVRAGARIEDILSSLDTPDPAGDEHADASDAASPDADTAVHADAPDPVSPDADSAVHADASDAASPDADTAVLADGPDSGAPEAAAAPAAGDGTGAPAAGGGEAIDEGEGER